MIPQDPVILYGFINTLLRDKYSSLKELCENIGAKEEEIICRLKTAGFEYDETINQFR